MEKSKYAENLVLKGGLWVFTLGDPDDKPSVPHAHAEELGYRLDAWTGNIYPAGSEREKTIGHLSRKELHKLHSDYKFLKFAKNHIDWYKATYPHINFYIPEWFNNKLNRDFLSFANTGDESDILAFGGGSNNN